MRNLITKKNILTIPNLLSFLRILLVPVFVWLYCFCKNYDGAVIIIAISALTDVADGKIARSFHMVSDFGKIIDPIADKLTQAVLIICLISRYRWMIALIILMLIKDGLIMMAGYLTLKMTDMVNGAKWYGKVNTVVLYAVMMTLVLFPRIPEIAANILIFLCGAAMLMSLMLYGRFYSRILRRKNILKIDRKMLLRLWKCSMLVIWFAIILAFIFYRDDISVNGILRFTPANPVLAAIVMLALFALKSLSIVVFIGILYTVNGILYSLPIAIIINLCGIAITVTLPYMLGKKIGSWAANSITKKYPKAEAFRKLCSNNDFFFSFIVRLVGLLPCDIVSIYMGAIKMPYKEYLLGCLLGMLPQMIVFSVIGMSITNIQSPAFATAVCAELLIIAGSIIFIALQKKHCKYNNPERLQK